MPKILKPSKPLKPLNAAEATGSLAEFISLSASYRNGMWQRYKNEIKNAETYVESTQHYQLIAEILPNVKRLSYDDSLLRLVGSTDSLETEDVLGQLSHASFPFDQFWIEGPIPKAVSGPNKENLLAGALITANQERNEFNFVYVTEYSDDSRAAYNSNNSTRKLHYFRDGKILGLGA